MNGGWDYLIEAKQCRILIQERRAAQILHRRHRQGCSMLINLILIIIDIIVNYSTLTLPAIFD